MSSKILLLPGDGIGVEIVDAARQVLAHASKIWGLDLGFSTALISVAPQSMLRVILFLLRRWRPAGKPTPFSSVRWADPSGRIRARPSAPNRVS